MVSIVQNGLVMSVSSKRDALVTTFGYQEVMETTTSQQGPEFPFGRLPIPHVPAPFEDMLRKALALDELSRIRGKAQHEAPDVNIFERLLSALGIRYEVRERDLDRLRGSGPLLVVSNHPFGMAEGLILGAAVSRRRNDVKILANSVLECLPELRDALIPVNPFGGKAARRANGPRLREALAWLRSGGALVLFPSGEVSHFDLKAGEITDPRWNRTVAALIRLTGAAAVPVFIPGCNGALFQVLGMMHPGLRTVQLPRQLLALRGRTVGLRIGPPVASDDLLALGGDPAITSYLRARTYVLSGRRETGTAEKARAAMQPSPVAEEAPPESVLREARLLLGEGPLARVGNFSVLLAEGSRYPHLLREIGRLREITFRAAGEGTGKSIDLDPFDSYYDHIVLWDQEREVIAGAYRVASAATVISRRGISGLYTNTLFRFSPEFFNQTGPALELGRSFIRFEFQRHPAALLGLWKGIGAYVCQRPPLRVLFGAVSISREYQPLSRQILASSLGAAAKRQALARHVTPRRPFRMRPLSGLGGSALVAPDLDELSRIIADLEPDGKPVPVLLKQYLRLGGQVLGFNLDPGFSDTLDALVVVDLANTPPAMLERYLGKSEAAAFLARQRPG
jgi:putative hemolysin